MRNRGHIASRAEPVRGRIARDTRQFSSAPDADPTGASTAQRANFPNTTMKTTKKQTQCQRLLAYLKRHKKGITTMEAFEHLGITCVHKRIAEIDGQTFAWIEKQKPYEPYDDFIHITRTPERTASGSIVTRYKLAR